MRKDVLFATPIQGKYHFVGETIQKAVEITVQEAEANGLNKRGKEVTPWTLGRIGEPSGGKPLPSGAPSCSCHAVAPIYHVSCRVCVTTNSQMVGSPPRMRSSRLNGWLKLLGSS